MSVYFIGAPSVALAYDSKHDRIVKVSRGTDDQGRVWEQYDDGPWVLVAMPNEPDVGPIATG
jgi:hypothetical protein